MKVNIALFSAIFLFASVGAQSKIIAGEDASLEEFPYIVQIETNVGESWALACGGTLVTKEAVLTTGQCISSFQEKELRVRVNGTKLGEDGYTIKISQLIIHENFTTNENGVPYFDVALIILSESITTSDTLRPIALAVQEPDNASNVSIAGWGTTEVDGMTLAENLQRTDLSVINRLVCNLMYNAIAHFANINEQFVCVRDTDGNKGACLGDAGGPVVAGDALVGIISFSWGCADPGFPLVTVNVAYFAEWILQKLSSTL